METGKTKNQLISEIKEAQRRLAKLEASDVEHQRTKKALRESEERYRRFFKLNPAGITTLDINGIITSCNQAVLDQSGYDEDDLIGKHFTEIFVLKAKEIPRFLKVFKSLLKGQKLEPIEVAYRRKDGSTNYLEAYVSLFKPDGRKPEIMVLHKDITERKRMEERINHLNLVLRAIRNVNQFITREKDRDRLLKGICEKLVETRGYYNAWIGLQKKDGGLELVAEASLGAGETSPAKIEVSRGETPSCCRQALQRPGVVLTEKNPTDCGDCLFASQHRERKVLTCRLECDGKIYGMMTASCPVDSMIMDSEETSLFEEVANDIGFALHSVEAEEQQRHAEEDLREIQEFNSSLLENAPNPIIVFNPDISIRYVNPAFEKLTGFAAAEITGIKPPFPWWCQEAEAEYATAAELKNDLDSGNIKSDMLYRRKNGEDLWVEVSVALINHEGVLKYYLINWNDITERQQAEQALRESEQKYRAIFEQAVDSILLIDPKNGEMVDFNDIACQQLGYTREEFAKLNMRDIDPYVNQERGAQTLYANLLRNGVDVFETKQKTKSSEIRNMLVSVRLVQLDGQELAMSICHDITERKRGQEALRESEEKYRAIFEQGARSVVIINLENDRIVDFNENAHKNLGYTREEFAKLNITDFDILQTEEDIRKNDDEIRRKGEHSFETKHRTKSGEIRDIRVYGKNFNIRGESYNMGIWHDITEEKRMAEALRESEEKYRAVFEQALNSIALIDGDSNRILDFNDTACQNLGYTREEFARLNLTDIAHPPEAVEERREIVRQQGGDAFESQHRTKSGEIRDVYIMARNMDIGGKKLVVNIWHDITESKQAEEKLRETETLQEIDRLRNQLLANVSHELRTPLASIKGFATMFLEYDRKLKSHEKRSYMETINRNVDRLTEFVDQLLDMSRLDAGALPMDKKPASLSRLLRETIAEARIRTPSHRFTLDIFKRLPKIEIDARRIRQVLDNCISNAVNYSQPGTEIAVSARKVNHEIMITITDQGIGIPDEDLPYVFDRMFRSRQRQLPEGGVGLGLSISKGLVQAHGGRMWIESEERKGSRCFFTLPQHTKTGSGDG